VAVPEPSAGAAVLSAAGAAGAAGAAVLSAAGAAEESFGASAGVAGFGLHEASIRPGSRAISIKYLDFMVKLSLEW
jgi:hypothetical protein